MKRRPMSLLQYRTTASIAEPLFDAVKRSVQGLRIGAHVDLRDDAIVITYRRATVPPEHRALSYGRLK